tara:strand:+ start:384 stop:620 length:237 start_codon:yes stop_codon:yes gene_type:complete
MDNLPDIDECKQVYESYCEHLTRNLRNVGDLLQVTVCSLIHAVLPRENFGNNSNKLHEVANRISCERPFVKKTKDKCI